MAYHEPTKAPWVQRYEKKVKVVSQEGVFLKKNFRGTAKRRFGAAMSDANSTNSRIPWVRL